MFKHNVLLSLLLFCLGKIDAQSTLSVRAFIQGYYNNTNHTMLSIIDPINLPNVFDTIRIELHESHNGNLAYSFPAIFDINGNASISVPAIYFGNTYYIALRHRNSIETWSALPVLITNNASYDFSTGIAQAYGNNMILVDVNGASALFTGDINQDGVINGMDASIIDSSGQLFLFGYYLIADLNGDGTVDGQDANFVDNNGNGIHAHTLIPHFTLITQTNHDFIFPNPANNLINISSTQNNLNGTLLIYSVNGSLIKSINNFEEGENIDISNLESGEYIVQLKDSERNFTQKLIVEN